MAWPTLYERCAWIAKHFVAIIFAAQLFGCVSGVEYQGTRLEAEGRTLIRDPDVYKVVAESYPRYQVTQRFSPPSGLTYPMADIEPSDVWSVTHALSGHYLIYSETYSGRLCKLHAQVGSAGDASLNKLSGNCTPRWFYQIWVSPEGSVSGKWQQLSNPEVTRLKSDRWIILTLESRSGAEWGSQPLFRPMVPK